MFVIVSNFIFLTIVILDSNKINSYSTKRKKIVIPYIKDFRIKCAFGHVKLANLSFTLYKKVLLFCSYNFKFLWFSL
jgi:hypothetical protein